MANEITISLGKAGPIKVDMDKVLASKEVANYILMYGLKQMLNDVHASEKDAKAKLGLSQKKLDSLYRGEVAQQRAAGGDPVAKLMYELAEQDIKNQIKALGRKLSDVKPETLKEAVKRKLEKDGDKYRKAAEAKLAIKVETASDVDIMDLLD